MHAALRQPREARDECGEEPRGQEALPRTEAVAADDERGAVQSACRRAQDGVWDWAAASRPVSRHLGRRGGGQEARKEVGARAGLPRPLKGTQLNAELEVAHAAQHLWGREGGERDAVVSTSLACKAGPRAAHAELEVAHEAHHLGHLLLGRGVLMAQRSDHIRERHDPPHNLRRRVAVVTNEVR